MALIHRWKLDEPLATDVAVDSVGGNNLVQTAGTVPVAVDPHFGFVRSWGAWVDNGPYLAGGPLNFAFQDGGDWSLAWWNAHPAAVTPAISGLFSHARPDFPVCTHGGAPHADGHPHQVCLGHLYVRIISYALSTGWNYAPNSGSGFTDNINFTEPFNFWFHRAIIRRGGMLEVWYNGSKGFETPYPANPPYIPNDDQTVGTFLPTPTEFWIGRTRESSVSETGHYELSNTKLADVRFYNHALTEAEIAGSVVSLSPRDNVAPVISNMTPAPGGAGFLHTTAIQFDVTDLSGLKRVPIFAKYPALNLWEVVYDGSNFAPHFSANSTKTAISDGFRFVLNRAGGWPSSPTISTTPYDTDGNEG